jgi:energy-coupling factor transport system substrate-specific component
MRDLLAVWRNTRLLVQVAVSAALYAAILIPFKPAFTLIPGITEVRPGNALPIVFALLFGPAAAWGSAFGNLIGDFFGTLGPGSIFGFVGNFLYAYVPYRVWGVHRLASKEPGALPLARLGIVEYVLTAGLASLVCAVVIAWGAEWLGLAPYKVLAPVITINNFAMSVLLGPALLAALYPRVRKWGLLWWQVLDREPGQKGILATVGALVCWAGAIGALVAGVTAAQSGASQMEIVRAAAPPLGVRLVGVLLI